MEHVYNPLPNVLDLGLIQIPLYGFFIMLGVAMALGLGLNEGKKIGIKSNDIIDGLIIILPLAILGARIWYVIFEWHRFSSYLPSILGFRPGGGFDGFSGLAIHGGFFVAVIGAYIYTKARNIDLYRCLDLVAPGFLVAQASGRWGNFFNQEAHGGVIGGQAGESFWDAQRSFLSDTLRLPDFITNNMFFNPGGSLGQGLNYYHPTFLYESVWNLVGLAILLVLRRTKFVRTGDMLAFYLIWYSVGRFMIESLRTDSLYLWNTSIRTAQAVSVLMILAGIGFIVYTHFVAKKPFYHEVLAENRDVEKEEV